MSLSGKVRHGMTRALAFVLVIVIIIVVGAAVVVSLNSASTNNTISSSTQTTSNTLSGDCWTSSSRGLRSLNRYVRVEKEQSM